VPTVQPTATVDPSLDNLIAHETGPGWIGGDSTYSTELPNGQDAFVFSDTLIGSVQPSGLPNEITGMVNNSELVGAMPNLYTNIDGTYGSPRSLIPDTSSSTNHWWVGSTYVENGMQLVFVNEFATGGSYGSFTGNSGIAALSLSDGDMPSYSSTTSLPTDPNTIWGTAFVQDASYTYVYGSDVNQSTGAFIGAKIARVPLGQTLNVSDWTYWNGQQWANGEAKAVAVGTGSELDGVSAQAGGSGFVAVSIPQVGSTVDLSYACTPTGPWSKPEAVYSIPQIGEYQGEIAYIPTFHPELTGEGGLVVSFNLNNLTNGATLQNVHLGQPQFLLLNG
jgi:uncharacterized protein (DUF697 family)